MKKINIHIIQHVEFEGPGIIKDWAEENGHNLTYTHIYNHENFPEVGSFDFLVIMGGPMSVNDTSAYYWIEPEKQFIRACIERGKPILGICLGAQFIAAALGARVYRGPEKEIGWFPVQFHTSWNEISPRELTVFHWHSDTFDIPEGANYLAGSQVVPNQGFIYKDNVFALQFHLEVKEGPVEALIENCSDDLTDDPYVQPAEKILAEKSYYAENSIVMKQILSFLCDKVI